MIHYHGVPITPESCATPRSRLHTNKSRQKLLKSIPTQRFQPFGRRQEWISKLADKEAYVFACECGSTLKLSTSVQSDLAHAEQLYIVGMWKQLHTNHEQVTCAEARQIRFNERRRRLRV